ncbi:hypothetical protein HPB50_027417 [Hyalomma asiaticum]|uniref:Uncharacterized protein n=1 Tax=Hyalomma asiaticum TaxID=266040 RepID=A0ACB7SKY5_HYAAI|nr:hypothetical protein HPB50_027417 [Hyalomma asiaticum]
MSDRTEGDARKNQQKPTGQPAGCVTNTAAKATETARSRRSQRRTGSGTSVFLLFFAQVETVSQQRKRRLLCLDRDTPPLPIDVRPTPHGRRCFVELRQSGKDGER